MSRGSRTALPMALLLGLALALIGAAAGTPAAALPEPGDPILVEITGLEPATPSASSTLRFSGTVTNKSGQDVRGLEVLLRVSPEPLGSRSAVAAVTDLTTARRGIAQEGTATPVTAALAPSDSAPFTITVPAADLPIGGNGVYAVFVEARIASGGSYSTAIPMPWFPDPSSLDTSAIVVVAPIRGAVDLTADNVMRSADLTSSMAGGGALHTLATGSAAAADAGVPVTWLIDPAVMQAAELLRTDQASFAASVSDPRAARASVASWLDAVDEGTAADASGTYVTPFAEVDASATLTADMPELLAEALLRSAATRSDRAPEESADDGAGEEQPTTSLATMPVGPDGSLTTAALLAYRQAGVSTVVLDASAVPPIEPLSYTPSGVAAVPLPDGASMSAVLPDEMLSANLSRAASTAAERFRLRQGLLADAAMITLELPTTPRTVVLQLPQSAALTGDTLAQALIELAAAPYTRVVGLPALLAPDVPRVERTLALDEADTGRLSGEYLSSIPALRERLAAFARVTVDPLSFEDSYRAAILRSVSANWRSDVERGRSLLASVEADLAVEESKVTTVSTGTVTFTGSSGSLPLTISNGLDQAVEVGVVLQAEPSVRLAYAPPGLVVVDAGRRASIEIPVEVFGSGSLPVSVILTDREGRPFITTTDLVIRSTAASAVAAIVVIVGAVSLLAMVLWRFRKQGSR